MAKRERRKPPPGEFEDPLSNYEPTQFSDELEESLCEDPLTVISHGPVLAVTPQAPVRQAVEMMADDNVGSVVVVEDDKPVGIFSQRDVLLRVADQFEQIKDTPVGEMMTPNPTVAHRTDMPARVINIMATGGFRHVPIVNADGKLVGLIGARRIIHYLKQHFGGVSSI